MGQFLADAQLVQCCVCCRRPSVVCAECIVAKRCVLVIKQKLLLTAYRKSYIRNRLIPKWLKLTFVEVVSRSCKLLCYIRRWISWKPLQIEAWFQRNTNRRNGIWAIKWSRDRWRHVAPKVLWGSRVGYPSDSLASCYYKLICVHCILLYLYFVAYFIIVF